MKYCSAGSQGQRGESTGCGERGDIDWHHLASTEDRRAHSRPPSPYPNPGLRHFHSRYWHARVSTPPWMGRETPPVGCGLR